ncbi:GIY-YIG nuclease family protein [Sphingomonas sp. BN140010]|uniref:GIY-YIG nuclease family protein n=1 Tax=Sphingomonas arvum TaxID=2992113 RepID=A0ABT3JEM1_9SPHN|nr:GIY-YIG nuclease family protein [Sphingomonas sp. BN140010]MCW3797374.1 GIY-YIG nuclease family protein [Sphingomonas sp. BN140010]
MYVLTNEAMPGYVKLGLTQGDDVMSRVRQLDTTAVPLPFECYFAAKVPDCARLERTLHFVFGERRVRRSREFFQIEPDLAKAIIELVAIEDVQLSDAQQAIDSEQRRDIEEVRKRREIRTFTSLNIPIGSKLTFAKNPDVVCAVTSPRKVQFRGQEMSPSRAALEAVHEMGYDWSAVSGMDYWLFNGVRLSRLSEGSAEIDPADDLRLIEGEGL